MHGNTSFGIRKPVEKLIQLQAESKYLEIDLSPDLSLLLWPVLSLITTILSKYLFFAKRKGNVRRMGLLITREL